MNISCATWTHIYLKIIVLIKIINATTSKAVKNLYNVTFIIRDISFAIIAWTLLNCMILKVSIKNSTIFLNVIQIETTDNTKDVKTVFELKDLFVFWSIFIKFINLLILFLFFFELKMFSSRKALLIFVMTIIVL